MRDDRVEREREEREEEDYEREAYGSLTIPDIHEPIKRVSAALVRDWVRANLVPAAVQRMHDIGHGVTKFDVPTAAGNTVRVPAPSSVQQRALAAIISIGVPQQLGLTGEGGELPGVIALGPLELDEARREAHQGRFPLPTSGGIEVPLSPASGAPIYTPPEGHEITVVEEGIGSTGSDTRGEVAPPAPPSTPTLAQQILARRRARKNGAHSTPSNGNGAH